MWLTVSAILFSLFQSPLPRMTEIAFQKHVQMYLTAKKTNVKKSKSHVLSQAEYNKRFKEELRKRGKPDEVAFLLSLIPGESNGDPLAVSFIASKPLPDGKRSSNLWHCGLVQTQSKSLGECRKIQRDPVYSADKALEILRLFDSRWPGSRKCNWKSGPNNKKCREIRAKNARTS